MLNQTDYIYSNPESRRKGSGNLIPFINYQKPAPARCLDMLLAKYNGEPFQSEVLMEAMDTVRIPNLKCPLKDAVILVITDGGLVPKGNPDRIPSTNAGRYGVYDIRGKLRLEKEEYEVCYQGYDNRYVEEDPNRLVPVDALRELERCGKIGKLYDSFIATTGVMTSAEKSIRLGRRIASYVMEKQVDAVIITSACGTSTRCGAYIGKELELKGIPVVQVTNLTQIAVDTGISRVIKGDNVCYPFGKPSLAGQREYLYRVQMAEDAVQRLQEYRKK